MGEAGAVGKLTYAFTFWQPPLCYVVAIGETMASSAPSPQDRDPFADRRVHPRVPVALPAFLDTGGRRHSVQMLDLSAGGVKLNCSASLSAGSTVMLDCGTFGRAAVVRWQNGEFLGLSFESELNDREMAALIDRSSALTARMKTRE